MIWSIFYFIFFSSEEGRIKSFSGFLLLDVKDNSVLLVEDLTEVCVYVVFDIISRWLREHLRSGALPSRVTQHLAR